MDTHRALLRLAAELPGLPPGAVRLPTDLAGLRPESALLLAELYRRYAHEQPWPDWRAADLPPGVRVAWLRAAIRHDPALLRTEPPSELLHQAVAGLDPRDTRRPDIFLSLMERVVARPHEPLGGTVEEILSVAARDPLRYAPAAVEAFVGLHRRGTFPDDARVPDILALALADHTVAALDVAAVLYVGRAAALRHLTDAPPTSPDWPRRLELLLALAAQGVGDLPIGAAITAVLPDAPDPEPFLRALAELRYAPAEEAVLAALPRSPSAALEALAALGGTRTVEALGTLLGADPAALSGHATTVPSDPGTGAPTGGRATTSSGAGTRVPTGTSATTSPDPGTGAPTGAGTTTPPSPGTGAPAGAGATTSSGPGAGGSDRDGRGLAGLAPDGAIPGWLRPIRKRAVEVWWLLGPPDRAAALALLDPRDLPAAVRRDLGAPDPHEVAVLATALAQDVPPVRVPAGRIRPGGAGAGHTAWLELSGQHDEYTSRAQPTRAALGGRPGTGAAPGARSDADAAVAALCALAEVGDAATLPVIADLLHRVVVDLAAVAPQDFAPAVPVEAVNAIAGLGRRLWARGRIRPAALMDAADATGAGHALVAHLALDLLERPEPAPGERPILLDLLRHAPYARTHARVHHLLRDPEPEVRRRVVALLARRAPVLSASLIALTRSDDDGTVREAVTALGAARARWAAEAIAACLEHPAMAVKKAAAEALVEAGTPAVAPALVGWLGRHDNRGFRLVLRKALAAVLGENWPEALLAAASGADPRTRELLLLAVDRALDTAQVRRFAERAPRSATPQAAASPSGPAQEAASPSGPAQEAGEGSAAARAGDSRGAAAPDGTRTAAARDDASPAGASSAAPSVGGVRPAALPREDGPQDAGPGVGGGAGARSGEGSGAGAHSGVRGGAGARDGVGPVAGGDPVVAEALLRLVAERRIGLRGGALGDLAGMFAAFGVEVPVEPARDPVDVDIDALAREGWQTERALRIAGAGPLPDAERLRPVRAFLADWLWLAGSCEASTARDVLRLVVAMCPPPWTEAELGHFFRGVHALIGALRDTADRGSREGLLAIVAAVGPRLGPEAAFEVVGALREPNVWHVGQLSALRACGAVIVRSDLERALDGAGHGPDPWKARLRVLREAFGEPVPLRPPPVHEVRAWRAALDAAARVDGTVAGFRREGRHPADSRTVLDGLIEAYPHARADARPALLDWMTDLQPLDAPQWTLLERRGHPEKTPPERTRSTVEGRRLRDALHAADPAERDTAAKTLLAWPEPEYRRAVLEAFLDGRVALSPTAALASTVDTSVLDAHPRVDRVAALVQRLAPERRTAFAPWLLEQWRGGRTEARGALRTVPADALADLLADRLAAGDRGLLDLFAHRPLLRTPALVRFRAALAEAGDDPEALILVDGPLRDPQAGADDAERLAALRRPDRQARPAAPDRAEWMARAKDGDRRALNALLRDAHEDDPALVALVDDLLHHPEPRVRLHALRLSRRVLERAAYLRHAAILLDDPLPDVVRRAILSVSHGGYEAAVPFLVRLLEHRHPIVRRTAAEGLVRLGPVAVPALRHAEGRARPDRRARYTEVLSAVAERP
ncbi:HEAT repeat domain-containing protein [Virgisporangium aliadipatigenens]|nr:HEAT repeat domain-containing protein [Virgisporangium aliadipatigenens]